MSESEVIECPKCDGEMEKGFIAAWYVFWTDEKQEIFWKAPPSEDILVKPTGLFHIYDRRLDAYRCSKCKLILFNYSDIPISETPKSFLKDCVKCGKEIPLLPQSIVLYVGQNRNEVLSYE
jgi:DNA-directed RNA polymerase subunit RPC12/RpoP